jgi:hypothetical protein
VATVESFAEQRFHGFVVPGECAEEPVAAAFQRDEAVASAAFPRGGQPVAAEAVEERGRWFHLGFASAAFHETGAVEIEAKFDAFRVETAGPVELAGGFEIVGLEAEAVMLERAEEGSPADSHGAPGGSFESGLERGGRHAR